MVLCKTCAYFMATREGFGKCTNGQSITNGLVVFENSLCGQWTKRGVKENKAFWDMWNSVVNGEENSEK